MSQEALRETPSLTPLTALFLNTRSLVQGTSCPSQARGQMLLWPWQKSATCPRAFFRAFLHKVVQAAPRKCGHTVHNVNGASCSGSVHSLHSNVCTYNVCSLTFHQALHPAPFSWCREFCSCCQAWLTFYPDHSDHFGWINPTHWISGSDFCVCGCVCPAVFEELQEGRGRPGNCFFLLSPDRMPRTL